MYITLSWRMCWGQWWRMAAAQGEGVGLPLASYRLPESPAFQIDITLSHSKDLGDVENKWNAM